MSHLTGCDCDECLLAQMAGGDAGGDAGSTAAVRQQGWEAWYRRDAAVLLAFIERRCRTLGCQEHSEDPLQDCFMVGFRSVSNGSYTAQAKGLRAYLHGIAKNLLHELYRTQRKGGVPQALDEELPQRQTMSFDDQIYLAEVCQRVQEAYRRQSTLHQRVVQGLYAEGKSSDELGRELGKTAGNTRAIARRVVNEIGLHLAREHGIDLSASAIRSCLQLPLG